MKHIRREITSSKPNVIPILDAVFIFIFFLLLSSEFLNIKKIKIQNPIIKSINVNDINLHPLNLTIFISKKSIVIKTGIPLKNYKQFLISSNNWKKDLKTTIIDLKNKNIAESTVNIWPTNHIKFEKIISIISIVQSINKDGQNFSNVVFNKD